MRTSLFVAAVLVLGSAACPRSAETRCLVDKDCGSGRAPFCVAGDCVECIRDRDCDDGLTCSGDGLCKTPSSSGEGEGEGASSGEGEGSSSGEGEGSSVGEGEGEGATLLTCDVTSCDAASSVCEKLLPADLSSCFDTCTPGDACSNVWGQAGACDVVDGEHVCVATGGVLSVCSAFGNSRCDTGLQCVFLAPAVSQCLTDCTQTSDCAPPSACFDFGADGKHCFAYAEGGEPCGFIADGTWRFCDVGFACAFIDGVASGTCATDANDDGIPDGETTNPDPTNPGGPGGGEGEGEGASTAPSCGITGDCVIASFGTPSDCATNADCNTGSISNNDACVKDSQNNGYCVLLSQDAEGLPCEEMPTNPRLTTVTGTDVTGATIAFCAHPAGVFCNVATSTCSGPPWH